MKSMFAIVFCFVFTKRKADVHRIICEMVKML